MQLIYNCEENEIQTIAVATIFYIFFFFFLTVLRCCEIICINFNFPRDVHTHYAFVIIADLYYQELDRSFLDDMDGSKLEGIDIKEIDVA